VGTKRHLWRYRFTKRAIAGLIVLYLSLVVHVELQPGRPEHYPFASWSLFSRVPNRVEDYSLRLLAVNGRPLTHPVWFEDTRLLFPAATNHNARVSIQRLGAVSDQDADEAQRMRRHVERLFLGGRGPVKYELTRRVYDPLQRWQTQQFQAVETVGLFETEQP
jgi:hypothetical protein